MSSAQAVVPREAETLEALRIQVDTLEAQNQALKVQPDWFKRQLFGSKSDVAESLATNTPTPVASHPGPLGAMIPIPS